jgi:hypothetical protein
MLALGCMLCDVLRRYGAIQYFQVLVCLSEKGVYHLGAFMRFHGCAPSIDT